ncbi:MAG: nicotinate-nucleotide--dimethylbenzimidazole phosphoribosyltransferase [Eubacteriales bacterium]|nr:nicotinate-nucleotide--dimethylbenzimidazole phosphoribosyltransferase [Eubacteriales bacterium]
MIKEEKILLKYLNQIEDIDKQIETEAKKYLDKLAKPIESLGLLEDIFIKLSSINNKVYNNKLSKKLLLIFASDNGIYEEKVSSAPQRVSFLQSINISKGKSAAGALAKSLNANIRVVDLGLKSSNDDLKEEEKANIIINKKICKSTKNIVLEDAFSYRDALKAILCGIEEMKIAKENDVDIVALGEMGIANTSTSTAILSILTNSKVDDICGRGGGLNDEYFENKKKAIKKAINRYKKREKDKNKIAVIDLLSSLGGLDICGMCGAILGAGIFRIPVIIDGYISIVSALSASKIYDNIKKYIFLSHSSYEKGYKIAKKALGLQSFLDLNMRLGEGSGALLMFNIFDNILSIVNNMYTFEKAKINDDYLSEIRKVRKYIK